MNPFITVSKKYVMTASPASGTLQSLGTKMGPLWWSPTFLAPGTGFMEENFQQAGGGRDGFGIIQAHYTYCALCYYYISSISDHQASDPGSCGPLF